MDVWYDMWGDGGLWFGLGWVGLRGRFGWREEGVRWESGYAHGDHPLYGERERLVWD